MPLTIDYTFEKLPKVHATLYRAGRLFAIGLVEVSEGQVTFYPRKPRSLVVALNAKMKLKVKKKPELMILGLSQEHLDTSTESIWYFELETIA
jgi:hypothetical protein